MFIFFISTNYPTDSRCCRRCYNFLFFLFIVFRFRFLYPLWFCLLFWLWLCWSKEIWDMAPVGWLIDPSWAPSVLVPTPVLTDSVTWSVDRSRHLMRYVYKVDRDAILRDFFVKLAKLQANPR